MYPKRWELEFWIHVTEIYRSSSVVAAVLVHPNMCSHHYLSIIYVIRAHDQHLKRKYKEQERTIYKEKVKALININHELRTPLTLIYTPLKQLTNSKQIPYELRSKLYGAFKQARQMKNIIDMILNMRKMEVEKNILRMSPAPFNEWLQSILNDFKDELSLRNISLIFCSRYCYR